ADDELNGFAFVKVLDRSSSCRKWQYRKNDRQQKYPKRLRHAPPPESLAIVAKRSWSARRMSSIKVCHGALRNCRAWTGCVSDVWFFYLSGVADDLPIATSDRQQIKQRMYLADLESVPMFQ